MDEKKNKRDLSEFYGIYNTTFDFIERNYGYDELVSYWEYMSKEYFSLLIKDAKKRGTEAFKQYWLESVEDDEIEYDMEIEPDRFQLNIESCSAIDFLNKDKHYPMFDKYCEHCRVVNSKIAALSGFEYEVDYDQKKGKCRHIFKK